MVYQISTVLLVFIIIIIIIMISIIIIIHHHHHCHHILITYFIGEITTGRIDCMGPAVAHKETKMKCNLTGKPPELGVVWARPDETNIVACLITTQSCDTAASVTDNYTASFDSNSTSTLTIHSFDPKTDVGVWHCKDGPNGSHTSCRKKLKGNMHIRRARFTNRYGILPFVTHAISYTP